MCLNHYNVINWKIIVASGVTAYSWIYIFSVRLCLRLSSDVNNLKGFNRADKGSQNNLVDFSESAEQLNASDFENADSSNEDADVETVFDMTAQGDSLKRKRKKNVNHPVTDNRPAPTFNVVSDQDALSVTDSFIQNEAGHDTAAASTKSVVSTNPFWCNSPVGDSVSLASSTSESNPFEKAQFRTAATAPASTARPVINSAAAFPALPPPPCSAKTRSGAGSSRRSRVREVTRSSALSDVRRDKDMTLESNGSVPPVGNTTTIVNYVFTTSSKPDSNTQSAVSVSEQPSFSDSPILHVSDSAEGADAAAAANLESQNPSILETTLSILDVYASPTKDSSSLNIDGSSNMETLQALQAAGGTRTDLRDASLDSLEQFQKTVPVDTPTDEPECAEEQTSLMHCNDLVPDEVTEWNMLMRFPREKRLMSSRKWVDIYVRLDTQKVGGSKRLMIKFKQLLLSPSSIMHC